MIDTSISKISFPLTSNPSAVGTEKSMIIYQHVIHSQRPVYRTMTHCLPFSMDVTFDSLLSPMSLEAVTPI